MEQNVARNLFVERLRAEAVGPGKVEHRDARLGRAQQAALLALNCHAGVIADFGAQTRERIEQSRFAAVGISAEDDLERAGKGRSCPAGGCCVGCAFAHREVVVFFTACRYSRGRTRICSASCLRSVKW